MSSPQGLNRVFQELSALSGYIRLQRLTDCLETLQTLGYTDSEQALKVLTYLIHEVAS
jgi:hypothetical protein